MAKQGGSSLDNRRGSKSVRKRPNGGGLLPLGVCVGISPQSTWVGGIDHWGPALAPHRVLAL
jgi:hypothetical protein